MNNKLLHTHAEDETGNLIHINNAKKGVKYYCSDPECKKEIIFRNSGKTGKGSKRPHFSHKKGTAPHCSPERALHEIFKKKLIDLLEKHKTENRPFIINWGCCSCCYKNSGNLLERIASIKEEYTLGKYRADIALLNKENRALVAIEVVVTHPPEKEVLQYYKDNRITLVQINLISEEDLIKVEEIAKNPHIVDMCMNPECLNREKYTIKREILQRRILCGLGQHQILEYRIGTDSIFGRQLSTNFTKDEIDWVKSNFKNIIIKSTRNNQGAEQEYPIMECLQCKKTRSRYGRNVRL